MTDALLLPTYDGGTLTVSNDQIGTSNGLYQAVYMALFGGNEDDSGDDAEASLQWWGNFNEPNRSRHLRSRTQWLMRGLPATTGNLRSIREAIGTDLDPLVADETLNGYSAVVSMTAPKRIQITVSAEANGVRYPFTFDVAWQSEEGR